MKKQHAYLLRAATAHFVTELLSSAVLASRELDLPFCENAATQDATGFFVFSKVTFSTSFLYFDIFESAWIATSTRPPSIVSEMTVVLQFISSKDCSRPSLNVDKPFPQPGCWSGDSRNRIGREIPHPPVLIEKNHSFP